MSVVEFLCSWGRVSSWSWFCSAFGFCWLNGVPGWDAAAVGVVMDTVWLGDSVVIVVIVLGGEVVATEGLWFSVAAVATVV